MIQDGFLKSSGNAADKARLTLGGQLERVLLVVVATVGKDVGEHRSREGILCGLPQQF